MKSVEWRFYHRTELKDRSGHVTRSRATTLQRRISLTLKDVNISFNYLPYYSMSKWVMVE